MGGGRNEQELPVFPPSTVWAAPATTSKAQSARLSPVRLGMPRSGLGLGQSLTIQRTTLGAALRRPAGSSYSTAPRKQALGRSGLPPAASRPALVIIPRVPTAPTAPCGPIRSRRAIAALLSVPVLDRHLASSFVRPSPARERWPASRRPLRRPVPHYRHR